jgi:hypothetical protein
VRGLVTDEDIEAEQVAAAAAAATAQVARESAAKEETVSDATQPLLPPASTTTSLPDATSAEARRELARQALWACATWLGADDAHRSAFVRAEGLRALLLVGGLACVCVTRARLRPLRS